MRDWWEIGGGRGGGAGDPLWRTVPVGGGGDRDAMNRSLKRGRKC